MCVCVCEREREREGLTRFEGGMILSNRIRAWFG